MKYTQHKIEDFDKYTPKRLKALLIRAKDDLMFNNSLFNSVCCAMFLVTSSGKISFANKFAQFMFSKNNLENILVFNLFKDRSIVKKLRGALLEKQKMEGYLLEVNLPSGISHVLCSINARIQDNTIQCWIISFLNYTDQYANYEQERRQEYLNSITQISTNISHEIKNPLGAISIHLQLLKKNLSKLDCCMKGETKLRDNLHGNIRVIEEEINNMNNVVSLLLNNISVDSSEVVEYNLNILVLDFIKFINPDIRQKNILCNTILEEKIPLVYISKSGITHVLLNVVKNAIEAMQDGGLITLKTYSNQAKVYISISDTGSGIQEEVRNFLFNPYVTTKEQGSGIGLTISAKIMQLHNGGIRIEKKYKKGSCFLLEFPRQADEQHLLENKLCEKNRVKH